ncbi:hypothetical protein B0T20DRAFT_463400 [Sordaria brevicollis]|uniref:Uncharacterized protein n=1 Tax=Sordaria brevicollis TaxID=83679 RepID=A0AAE0U9W0_SORBR|nr:hypothetical protein B0T20DRAFT_463400 [Sordaria brevicollis]
MSSSLWSSDVAVHAYRVSNPNMAVLKAILNGTFEAHSDPSPAQVSNQQDGPATEVDDNSESDDSTQDVRKDDDQSSIAVAESDYVSFPPFDGQTSPIDVDKYHHTRKVSTETTSSQNSKTTVNSDRSKNTAETNDTEYTQPSIASPEKRQCQTKAQSDETGSARNASNPTGFRSFPTLPHAPSPCAADSRSPTPLDLGSAYGSSNEDTTTFDYASDDDSYYSDDADDNHSITTDDEFSDLSIVHTVDREEYGLQYVGEHECFDPDHDNGKKQPKLKAIVRGPGEVEMVTYYSDDEELEQEDDKEEQHPMAEFSWKKEQYMPKNWQVLAWYEHPKGEYKYNILGSDHRWYWACDGGFMLMVDEELEEFNSWRWTDSDAVLIWNGDVKEEEEAPACVPALETIQEEDEESDEELCKVKEDDERKPSGADWDLDDVFEEVTKAFVGLVIVDGKAKEKQDLVELWRQEVVVEDSEDDEEEDWKCFI